LADRVRAFLSHLLLCHIIMNTTAPAIAAKSKKEKGGLIPNRIRELDWVKLAR